FALIARADRDRGSGDIDREESSRRLCPARVRRFLDSHLDELFVHLELYEAPPLVEGVLDKAAELPAVHIAIAGDLVPILVSRERDTGPGLDVAGQRDAQCARMRRARVLSLAGVWT